MRSRRRALQTQPIDPAEDLYEKSQRFSLRALYRLFVMQPKSLWFACAYLFFEYVRPQSIYEGIDILPWPWLCLALCLVFGVAENQKQYPAGGITTGMVLMCFVALLSSFFAYSPAVSFANWHSFYDWAIIYFIVKRAVNDKYKLLLFVMLFFLASFKMTQHGFFSWASRGFAYTRWGLTGGPGWFHNSGEFGIQICIFVPLLLGVAIGLYKNWSLPLKLFIGFVLLTGIASAIGSTSRGALLGLGAAGIWMAMRSKYFIRGMLGVSLVAYAAYTYIPAEFMARFGSSGEDSTSLHRLERWEHGWEAMKDNPLFGVGMKNWETYYPAHFSPDIPGPMMVHNIFIEAGSELGFIGLGVFLLLILMCLSVTRKVRKLADPEHDKFFIGLSYGLDGALVGMLVSSSFVTVFYYPYFWIHCLMVGCLHASMVAEKNRKSQGPSLSGETATVLPAARRRL